MKKELHESLLDAACSGDIAAAKKLLAAGAHVNYQNDQINTPLMWAVTHRHRDMVQLLLGAGADINMPDILGCTALIVAAANGDAPMVETLLKHGANVNHRDLDGNTALAWATHNKHTETARLLDEWHAK